MCRRNWRPLRNDLQQDSGSSSCAGDASCCRPSIGSIGTLNCNVWRCVRAWYAQRIAPHCTFSWSYAQLSPVVSLLGFVLPALVVWRTEFPRHTLSTKCLDFSVHWNFQHLTWWDYFMLIPMLSMQRLGPLDHQFLCFTEVLSLILEDWTWSKLPMKAMCRSRVLNHPMRQVWHLDKFFWIILWNPSNLFVCIPFVTQMVWLAVGSGTCSAEADAFAGRLAKHPAVSGAVVLPQDHIQRGTCWMELGLSGVWGSTISWLCWGLPKVNYLVLAVALVCCSHFWKNHLPKNLARKTLVDTLWL